MKEINVVAPLRFKMDSFCNTVLTFESVDEILWCDHSNEISVLIISRFTVCSSAFCKVKLVNCGEF